MGGKVNGVVYHPYDKGDALAESIYEPPYYDYLTWVNTAKADTKLIDDLGDRMGYRS